MDEPTAALSGVEVERLFTVARRLRDEGRALVFISHRFDEVFDLCDTVTVLRDGAYVDTLPVADTDVDRLVALMVGREVGDLFPKTPAEVGEPVLEVTGLTSPGVFHDVSFEVRAGEIVGLAGLVGAGRSEIARAVFGVDGYQSGEVTLGGRRVPKRNPRAAIRAGMAFIPEDRRKQGLVIDASVARNVAAVIRTRLDRGGLLTQRAENKASGPWAAACGEDERAGRQRHDHERRQPAEGRHREVARHRAEAAHHRRAHARDRRRHQGRGAPAALGAGRPGHRHPDDLLRAPRGARHGRPGARRVRGPPHRRHPARRGDAGQRHACRHADPGGRRDDRHVHPPRPRPRRPHHSLLVAPSQQSPARRAFKTVVRSRESSILLVLVLVVTAATIKNPSFLFSANSWRDLLLTPSILLLLAIGQAS